MSDLSPSLQTLKASIGENQFIKVRNTIESMSTEADILGILQDYFPHPKAKELASNIFKDFKNDSTIVGPTDTLQSILRKSGIPQELISDIRHFIKQDKRGAVKNKLWEYLGMIKGEVLYKEILKFMPFKPSLPLTGSKFIQTKNGLKLYSYNEKLSQQEKTNARTLIVFGQSGSGKQTFINMIVNYIAKVQMQDTFRYIIFVDNSDQTKGITKTVNDFYIKNKRTGLVYRIFDTPSLEGADGLQYNEESIKKISNEIRNHLQTIHGVLLVIKASKNTITAFQKYIFQSIMDIFDKQIASNFIFILTFSDSGKPQVLPLLEDKTWGFGKYWNQMSEPKYIEVNNCAIFQRFDEKDIIMKAFWKMGVQGVEKLLHKVNLLQPKSLTKSKEMIKAKETLKIRIFDTGVIIHHVINRRLDIKRQIQMMMLYKNRLEKYKNFINQVQQEEWYAQYINGNIVRKPRKTVKIVVNQRDKAKFDESKEQIVIIEAKLNELSGQLQKDIEKVMIAKDQIAILHEQLAKVQMSYRKHQSMKDYLHFLISQEQLMQQQGYLKRIGQNTDVIKQLQLHENILNGSLKGDFEKLIDQIKGKQD